MHMDGAQGKTSISPRELHRRLAGGMPACLLDVRSPGEFETLHVPGARLVPLGDLEPDSVQKLRGGPNTPIFIFCQSGGRARQAIAKLERAEVRGCILVAGGTQAWLEAGLPVNRGQRTVLPLMRQVQIAVGSISGAGALLALSLNPLFALVPLAMGCGLLFAGISGTCGLASLLAKMPWNRANRCRSTCLTKEA